MVVWLNLWIDVEFKGVSLRFVGRRGCGSNWYVWLKVGLTGLVMVRIMFGFKKELI